MNTKKQEEKHILTILETTDPRTEAYSVAVRNLETLRSAYKPPVGMDTVVSAVTNILGILVILNFEQVNVLTSKAVSFVKKI